MQKNTRVAIRAPALSFVEWRRGYLLPPKFTASVDDPNLPYLAELELSVDEGEPVECTSVKVTPRDGGEPLTARGLRSLPLGRLIQVATAMASRKPQRKDGAIFVRFDGNREEIIEAYELARPRVRLEGRRLPDGHYRAVADVYKRAKRNPTKAVREHEAWAPITYSTAARWVMEARRRGYLPPAGSRRGPKEEK